jgi:uncharacterized protein (DUF58 family)
MPPPVRAAGPGPIPQALIEALDVAVNRLISRTLPGERRAAGVGLGMELAQIRPYEVGDDVRHIDPAATARSAGQPHIRLHVPERALTTWIALDVSPSMAFGTSLRLKADVAEGVALVFGRLGVRPAGSVGLVEFGAASPRIVPPRGSKPGMVTLRRMLAEGVAPDGHHDPAAITDALKRLAKLARQPGLVVRLPRSPRLGASARVAARPSHAIRRISAVIKSPMIGSAIGAPSATAVALNITPALTIASDRAWLPSAISVALFRRRPPLS